MTEEDNLNLGKVIWEKVGSTYNDNILEIVDKIDEEVHQRALQAFFSHNIHATKERTGILIMVSLLEHRVEILADTGINAKVSKDTWQEVLTGMVSKIKSNELTDGICIAVQECGEILAKDFPGLTTIRMKLKIRLLLNR